MLVYAKDLSFVDNNANLIHIGLVIAIHLKLNKQYELWISCFVTSFYSMALWHDL